MDTPLYQGARPSQTASPEPLQTPHLAAQATQQAVQRGAQALDAAIQKFTNIQDFGEDQRIEGLLNDTTAEFDQDFTRRATLAPGSEDSLYDENGKLHQAHLDNLISDYTQRIADVRPRYINPDARLRTDALLNQTGGNLRIRALGKAAEREIQTSRQAYQNNLQSALDRSDYPAVRRINSQARENALITQTQHDHENWKYHQADRLLQFQKNLTENPLAVAAQYEDGLYDDIAPDTRLTLEKQLQTALRQQARPIPFTEEERKAIEKGGSIQPKYDRQPGDTEQMVKWREAKNNGLLHQHKPEIDAAWREDIYNAPVLKTSAQYNAWKNNLLNTWCDEKTGFGANPEELSLAADERIAVLTGLATAKDKLNASEFFNTVAPEDIAPAFHARWRDKAETWYWTDSNREKTEGAAYLEYQKKTAQIRNDAYKTYLLWQQDNPKATYYEQYSKACSLLAARAKSIDDENEVKSDSLLFKYQEGNYGDGTYQKAQEALTTQQDHHKTLREKRAQSIAAAQKNKAHTSSPTLPPITATDIQPIPDDAPGAYLSKQDYEKVLEYYGDAPELIGVLPGTGSQRACCRVPVLGWHDGEGLLLTRGARHGQLGKVGRIDGLEVRFNKTKTSKILTPEDRKKQMEKKRRKEQQSDLLPPLDNTTGLIDDGLLPLNENQDSIEIATPISDLNLPE